MDKKTTLKTKTFEAAIREICVIETLSDGLPHVYCNMERREAVIKNYGLTKHHAKIIIDRVQKEADEKMKTSELQ